MKVDGIDNLDARLRRVSGMMLPSNLSLNVENCKSSQHADEIQDAIFLQITTACS
jgi:hypothetical protein